MRRDSRLSDLKHYLADYLKYKGIDTEKAFYCLNPDHRDTHPSMHFDTKRNKAHCFSCGADYDIFDIIGIDSKLDNFKAKYKRVCSMYPTKNHCEDLISSSSSDSRAYGSSNMKDYTHYLGEAKKRISSTDYLQKRGLSLNTIANFGIGFDPHFHIGTGEADWQAIIIPTGINSFTARNIDKDAKADSRYRKIGGSPIFNIDILKTSTKPIFVVEGEIDALSIIEIGEDAIALGSISNQKNLITALKTNKPALPLMICLDNDLRGKDASQRLISELEKLGILCVQVNTFGLYKDANEALVKDKPFFVNQIREALLSCDINHKDAILTDRDKYLRSCASNFIPDLSSTDAEIDATYIPTGFSCLDSFLDGGLYEGLYVIGGISAIGKTTFIMQMVDQIAQAGCDVLVFSLENSGIDLVAKSLSRITYLDSLDKIGDMNNAKTARQIIRKSSRMLFSTKEKECILKAQLKFQEYGRHIFIHDCDISTDVISIKKAIENHILFTGNKPVVVIDYIQLLLQHTTKITDKQSMDIIMYQLKQLSRKYNISLVGISSLNRINYNQSIGMDAFKESGAIEYSSDVLLGLQYKGAGTKESTFNTEKNSALKYLELVIVKNRHGESGKTINFMYTTPYNCFCEDEQLKVTKPDTHKRRGRKSSSSPGNRQDLY